MPDTKSFERYLMDVVDARLHVLDITPADLKRDHRFTRDVSPKSVESQFSQLRAGERTAPKHGWGSFLEKLCSVTGDKPSDLWQAALDAYTADIAGKARRAADQHREDIEQFKRSDDEDAA